MGELVSARVELGVREVAAILRERDRGGARRRLLGEDLDDGAAEPRPGLTGGASAASVASSASETSGAPPIRRSGAATRWRSSVWKWPIRRRAAPSVCRSGLYWSRPLSPLSPSPVSATYSSSSVGMARVSRPSDSKVTGPNGRRVPGRWIANPASSRSWPRCALWSMNEACTRTGRLGSRGGATHSTRSGNGRSACANVSATVRRTRRMSSRNDGSPERSPRTGTRFTK